ncbi:MAG: rod shape-determining protein MreC [Flavobacteriales bacterium]|nr:rod shape-determining protein MreC [Flavobacteriales bacterium]
MQKLTQLLQRFGFVGFFLILEIIAFVLIYRRNIYHQAVFNNATAELIDRTLGLYTETADYFMLREENKLLAEENARLRAEVASSKYRFYDNKSKLSTPLQAYQFLSCKVVNNTTRQTKNYFIIDAGAQQGVKPDMGIISPNGIAGVVVDVSDNFALCLSVLHIELPVSVQLRKTKDFGSLEWDGKSPFYSNLMYIPTHVEIEQGDTIETSIHSTIFPEGIPVGTIESYTINPDDGYYIIRTKLFTRFTALRYVYVVNYLYSEEQKALENRKPIP